MAYCLLWKHFHYLLCITRQAEMKRMKPANAIKPESLPDWGRPKRRPPTPIAFRLGQEWADLWDQLRDQVGIGPTELFKQSLKVRALLESVDDSGKPLRIIVHLPNGEQVDIRDYLNISDSVDAT